MSVSILQPAKPQQQPFTALLKAVASVDSRVLSSPCKLHRCTLKKSQSQVSSGDFIYFAMASGGRRQAGNVRGA